MRHPFLTFALCATAFLVIAPPAAAQAEPKPAAGAAAADPKPGAAGKRTPDQIVADLEKVDDEIRAAIGADDALVDPAKRAAAAPKAIPALKRKRALLEEIAALRPDDRDSYEASRLEFLNLLALLGDDESVKALDALAGSNAKLAVEAQAGRQFVALVLADKDEPAQLKVLDELQKIAKANPKSNAVAETLLKVKMSAAPKAVVARAEDIILADLTGEAAKEYGDLIKGERKMRQAVGKPFEIAGPKVDGKPFSTKDWKGKVILIDFWATWCEPCVREMPRIRRAYIDYHAKGLEVLGVTCDDEADRLQAFLAQRNDIPWPHLWDAAENPKIKWHPIAKEWGVFRLPAMFLVDRKGVLRSVDAKPEYEALIPKLLEEKAE
jgi:thiol-disulfide isomerase/thioredoxin